MPDLIQQRNQLFGQRHGYREQEKQQLRQGSLALQTLAQRINFYVEDFADLDTEAILTAAQNLHDAKMAIMPIRQHIENIDKQLR